MRELFGTLERIAPKELAVLIQGETGTGKEEVARAIHIHSPRSAGPFIVIDATALPEALAESLLFGHEKGAFTGASNRKPGKFEMAHRGTLFLDEIGELPLSLQAKILRALEEKKFERVGGTSLLSVDVRVVAATNRNLRAAIAARQFREDLFFRLSVFPITIPPLRERPSDIPLLAEFFLSKYWTRHRGSTMPLPRFSDAAVRALRGRAWKGNVRELQNVMEHMVVLLEPGGDIRPEDIPSLGDRPQEPSTAWAPANISADEPYYTARDRLIAEFELHYLRQLLAQAGGNMSRAARAAGVDRTTLYRLMERHGLDRRVLTAPEPQNDANGNGAGQQNEM
jgi:transcriptional regulator with GAF, ATPase, and Fis domain